MAAPGTAVGERMIGARFTAKDPRRCGDITVVHTVTPRQSTDSGPAPAA